MVRRILSLIGALLLTPLAPAQGVNGTDLLKPLGDAWLTYNGDYTAKRYSALTAVNRATVKNLTLAWSAKVTPGNGLVPLTGYSRVRAPLITGGEGPGVSGSGGGSIKGTLLESNGVLYATTPDNVWALDARTGEVLWHYFWKTRGGTHIGNRGVGLWHDYLFVETPDDYLVSLDARTGKERWHREIAKVEGGYFATAAPVVVKNHVLAGVGNDLDAPSFLKSFDPETGDLQWTWHVTPQQQGDPGLDTWKSLDASRHGGGGTWVAGAYDPDTNLCILGTGNPTPSWTTGCSRSSRWFAGRGPARRSTPPVSLTGPAGPVSYRRQPSRTTRSPRSAPLIRTS